MQVKILSSLKHYYFTGERLSMPYLFFVCFFPLKGIPAMTCVWHSQYGTASCWSLSDWSTTWLSVTTPSSWETLCTKPSWWGRRTLQKFTEAYLLLSCFVAHKASHRMSQKDAHIHAFFKDLWVWRVCSCVHLCCSAMFCVGLWPFSSNLLLC